MSNIDFKYLSKELLYSCFSVIILFPVDNIAEDKCFDIFSYTAGFSNKLNLLFITKRESRL